MSVTLDTSQLEMLPLNDVAEMSPLNELVNASKNNQLISVIAETSQFPIDPRGPLEQSVDSCRHSLMAAWRSAFDLKAQPGVEYSRGYTVGVRATVRITITFRVRVWGCSCGGGCGCECSR